MRTARIRRRRARPRARTISVKALRSERRALVKAAAWADLLVPSDREALAERPRTRSECRDAPRPCPWIGCKYHLYLDVNRETGAIKINFPDLEPWELAESCVLDVAERGAITLEEVGGIMNITRERVRQVEVMGLIALRGGALRLV